MQKKYFIRGYKQKTDFPILYDFRPYPWVEAIEKAKEYFENNRFLCKVILFKEEEADEKIAAKSIHKNKLAKLGEIGDWWENN